MEISSRFCEQLSSWRDITRIFSSIHKYKVSLGYMTWYAGEDVEHTLQPCCTAVQDSGGVLADGVQCSFCEGWAWWFFFGYKGHSWKSVQHSRVFCWPEAVVHPSLPDWSDGTAKKCPLSHSGLVVQLGETLNGEEDLQYKKAGEFQNVSVNKGLKVVDKRQKEAGVPQKSSKGKLLMLYLMNGDWRVWVVVCWVALDVWTGLLLACGGLNGHWMHLVTLHATDGR